MSKQSTVAVREPDSAARPEGKPRLDWLDGLRAYAIVGVILVHSLVVALQAKPLTAADHIVFDPAGQGHFGVQLFFVISALTAYYTLGRHVPSFRGSAAWLTKRYLRIAPLYYVAIPLYFGVGSLMNWGRTRAGRPGVPVFTAGDALRNVVMVHAWTPRGNNNVVPGGWSIGVEVMFYLLAPLCFAIYRQRTSVALAGFAALGGACLWLTHVCVGGPVEIGSFFYYWFPTEFPVILCGLCLCRLTAVWMFGHGRVPTRAVAVAGTLFLPICGLTYVCGRIGGRHDLWAPTLAGGAFCCLVVLARGPWQALFANRFASWLGRLSYSVYIVHFVAMFAIMAVDAKTHVLARMNASAALLSIAFITLAFGAGVAILTRRWIEEPGIRWGHILAARIERRRPA
jgi:peptidoglycan/LPS O-acetylase OafA/YrhL